jgi:peptidoglycan biosynthesis protein MviN/MurJ (putative lipid II flippase)
MSRMTTGLETRALLILIAKLLLAGAAMAGICLASNRFLFHDLGQMSALARIAGLSLVIPVAGGVYFFLAKLFRVEEAAEFLAIVRRRIGKRVS